MSANEGGLTPAERAAMDRVLAGVRELEIASQRLRIEVHDMEGAFRNFNAALEAMHLGIDLDAAEEVATHPDLVELNVAMDGWYA